MVRHGVIVYKCPKIGRTIHKIKRKSVRNIIYLILFKIGKVFGFLPTPTSNHYGNATSLLFNT